MRADVDSPASGSTLRLLHPSLPQPWETTWQHPASQRTHAMACCDCTPAKRLAKVRPLAGRWPRTSSRAAGGQDAALALALALRRCRSRSPPPVRASPAATPPPGRRPETAGAVPPTAAHPVGVCYCRRQPKTDQLAACRALFSFQMPSTAIRDRARESGPPAAAVLAGRHVIYQR
jgi:hypothetical protein